MLISSSESACVTMSEHLPGAQTGRRGGAGPAGGLLGGKDPAGRFALIFGAEDAMLDVLCGYGFFFIFPSSLRHFAAWSGLSQAS